MSEMKKKIVITNKKNFKLIKKLMTKEEFHSKFEVPMKILTSSLADDAMLVSSIDSRLASPDDIAFIKNNRVL